MNPTICPYTFDEIARCKNIDEITLMRDWVNLCSFSADINPRKFCGNPTLYHYQLKNLLNCKRNTKIGKSI